MAQQFWIRSEGIRVTVLEDEDGVARNFVEGKFEGCRDLVNGQKRNFAQVGCYWQCQ